jgi:multiple sugar transport system ATP-binding protein
MGGLLIENLTKTYPAPGHGRIQALQGVTLSVHPGEFLVVLGPSGSGKTTLLRTVAGLEEPTAGTISIAGRVVNSLPPEAREVAMVFQEPSLYPHMTIRGNLEFGLKLRKYAATGRVERVRTVGELLGLQGLLDRMPKDISGGERQRVALGRAMVLNPKVLLFDEPLSNLDGPLRAEIRREILHRRSGATVLYVTHDQLEAMSLADRIAVLKDGVLLQLGTPREIYQAPANLFVAQFLGSPSMNLFHGVLHETEGVLSFLEQNGAASGGLTFIVPKSAPKSLRGYVGKEIVFGLRPENIFLQNQRSSSDLDEPWIEASLEHSEFLGPDTLVFLRNSRTRLIAKAPADFEAVKQSPLRVYLQVENGHFFDSSLGVRCT